MARSSTTDIKNILNIIVFQNIFGASYRTSPHETMVPDSEMLLFSVRMNVPPRGPGASCTFHKGVQELINQSL